MIRGLKIAGLAAVGAAAVWSGSAMAAGEPGGSSTCSAPGYSSTYSSRCSGNAVKNSAQITSTETLRVAATQTAGLIASRVASFVSPTGIAGVDNGSKVAGNAKDLTPGEGGNAGNELKKFGIWMNGSGAVVDNDATNASFSGNVFAGLVGMDYKFDNGLLIGLSGGYETSNIGTSFNSGSIKGNGYTVAPYVAYMFTKNYSVDASGGYSWLGYDTGRTDPLTGSIYQGETDAQRYFGSIGFNANYVTNNFVYGARLGAMYASEEKNAFTETTISATAGGLKDAVRVAAIESEIGQVQFGGHLGYTFFNTLTPYAKAMYRYDYEDGGASDSDDFQVGGGLKVNFRNSIIGGVEVLKTMGRDNTDVLEGAATLRFQF